MIWLINRIKRGTAIVANGWGGSRRGSGAKPKKPTTVEIVSYVYVIGSTQEPEVCKVGITRDLARRMRTLQTGHWIKLSVVAAFEMPDWETAVAVEETVLYGYAKHGIRGEWFSINPVIMAEAVRTLISRIGLPQSELIDRLNIAEWGLELINQRTT